MKLTKLCLLSTLALSSGLSGASLDLTATDDAYIRESQGNQGDNDRVLIGDTTTADDFLRVALAFDLTNPLLTGATINSATLTMTYAEDDSSSANELVTIDLHQLSSSFTNDGVTWTSRNGTDDWTTAGGDFGGILASASTNPFTASTNDTVTFSSGALATQAQGTIGGSLFLLLKLNNEDTAARNIVRFYGEAGVDTEGPVASLNLNYTAVPEPSAFALVMGVFGVVCLRRSRRA